MAKIPETLNLGNTENLTTEDLLRIINDLYTEIAVNLNKKVEFYERSTDGQATDVLLPNGTVNLNNTTQNVEMLVDRTATTVTWKAL